MPVPTGLSRGIDKDGPGVRRGGHDERKDQPASAARGESVRHT
ncbi:MAG TPA: hypothetical protein VEK08_24195 [Planctomycetota bacterium]|nr:hypothetical protein [Planctomycetota bacterium]